MKIVFRADASIAIGTGHIMRCLTLADSLYENGIQSEFICKNHQGNLITQIVERGYKVHILQGCQIHQDKTLKEKHPASTQWLGGNWSTDAEQTINCICKQKVDWLIVDHYSLDARWEKLMRTFCRKIMVIDDLANRDHDCDLLLDQTYKRLRKDYQSRVPDSCIILTGVRYVLLRPEFARLREYSLQRRKKAALKHLLISMGGIDKENITCKILQTLKQCNLPVNCRISIVTGISTSWFEEIKVKAKELPWPTEIMTNVTDMARLMAESDLAIGAAGGSSWERCCLGVPTIMLVLAENQQTIAATLAQEKAVMLLNRIGQLKNTIDFSVTMLREISHAAGTITDGTGTKRVADAILACK